MKAKATALKIKRRIQALWSAHKWKIVAGLFLAAALSVYIAWPVSRAEKIESTLGDYHHGQIKDLSFWPISESAPDSILVSDLTKEHSRLTAIAIWANNAGAELNYKFADDSLFRIRERIAAIKSKPNNATGKTYTACFYVVSFNSDRERRSDTVSAIINDSLRVVWVKRK